MWQNRHLVFALMGFAAMLPVGVSAQTPEKPNPEEQIDNIEARADGIAHLLMALGAHSTTDTGFKPKCAEALERMFMLLESEAETSSAAKKRLGTLEGNIRKAHGECVASAKGHPKGMTYLECVIEAKSMKGVDNCKAQHLTARKKSPLILQKAAVKAKGTCNGKAPKNPCGPCNSESDCGGKGATIYCWAKVSKHCLKKQREQRAAGASSIDLKEMKAAFDWELLPELISKHVVALTNKSLALILTLEIYQRAGNAMVLYLPEKGRYYDLDSGCFINEIVDLDNDGVSEIQRRCGFMGQGYWEARVELFQVGDDGVMNELLSSKESNNYGTLEPDEDKGGTSSAWSFEDLNGDGIKDIIEEVEETRGDKTTVHHKRYLFDGKTVRQTK